MVLAAMTSVSAAPAAAACVSSALLFVLFLLMPLFFVSSFLWSGVSSFFGFATAGGVEVVSAASMRVLSSSVPPLAMGFSREMEGDGGR